MATDVTDEAGFVRPLSFEDLRRCPYVAPVGPDKHQKRSALRAAAQDVAVARAEYQAAILRISNEGRRAARMANRWDF